MSSIVQERFGTVRFEPKGTIDAEEGVTDTPSRVIVVQIKPVVPSPWPMTEGQPGQFPRAGAVKLFETDGFNVWDQTFSVAAKIAPHQHYVHAVGIYLAGGKIRVVPMDGQAAAPPPARAVNIGDIAYVSSPTKALHVEEQAEDTTPRCIWIEFKYGH